MAIQQFNAKATLKEGVKVDVKTRQFNFSFDEPHELGGEDSAPNPVEVLLGSLGACQAIVARVYAPKFDVALDEFKIEIEGDIDIDGFLGVEGIAPGFQEVRYHFHIKSPSKQENIDAFLNHLEQHCPVGDTLARAVKLVRAGVTVNSREVAA